MARQADDWDAGLYASKHGFVHSLVADLLDDIGDYAEQRVLDVGCGTGELTDEMRRRGANVVGVDSSLSMVDAARERFPDVDFLVGDVKRLSWQNEFDVVFSNAALHWVLEAEPAAKSLARALKPGGRLLLEMGGSGNVAIIRRALSDVLRERGHASNANTKTWYFPTIAQYSGHLERAGFIVRRAALFERPTPLDGDQGMANWLHMFGRTYLAGLDTAEVETIISATVNRLRDKLCSGEQWHADYVRLRIHAEKPGE